MPTYNYNLNSVAENNSQQQQVQSKERIAVRVVDIILSPDHPEYTSSEDLGAIKYRILNRDYNEEASEDLPKAYPLGGTFKKYPLKNEVVYLESAPAVNLDTSANDTRTYYSEVVNIWNHPHHNAFPDINIYDGTLDLGEAFEEAADINPLLPKSGDILIEGRRGQSIRFSGTEVSTKIANGQIATENGYDAIEEDINQDGSSFYMLSNKVSNLQPASTLFKSYSSEPTLEFQGEQVVINSGRVHLNARDEHMLFTAKNSIGLSAGTLNFDTSNTVNVNAKKINLGSKDANHPVLKGDDTVEVMMELFDTLLSLTTSLVQGASQPNTVMPTVIEQGSATTFVLINLKTRLEGLKSRKTYTD